MCGIAGFSHTTDVTQAMLPHLLWEIEDRGRDSWGATDGTNIIRRLGAVTSSFYDHKEEINTWERGIFHTRAASHGSVTIENQHPFVFDEGEPGTPTWKRTIVGIHNGIIANHQQLNTRYSRGFDVDSMHIFKHLAERRPTGELQGYGNLAWYTSTPEYPEGILHLCRFNSDALHIARLTTGEIVFCSTPDPIRRAAYMVGVGIKTFIATEEEQVYYIKFDGSEPSMFKSQQKLPFGTRTSYQSCTAYTSTEWPAGRRGNYSTVSRSAYLAGTCAMMSCNNKVTGTRKTSLVCDTCWKGLLADAPAGSTRLEVVHV